MLDPDAISAQLEKLSDGVLAKKRGKQLAPFRGLRGTPPRDLVKVLVEAWQAKPRLPRDAEGLNDLFVAAHEDGLVAIGLVAALAPDSPADALDLADRWLPMVDDVETADALGWMVVGPGLMASGEPFADTLLEHRSAQRAEVRRMAVMATMAALPVALEGPAAAALRERTKNRNTAFVTDPIPDAIAPVVLGYLRDTSPLVQKAITRVMRTWATLDPDRVLELMNSVSGGVSKKLRQEINRGATKGRRQRAEAARALARPEPDHIEPWEQI